MRFITIFLLFLTQIFAEILSIDEAVKITPSLSNSQIEFKFEIDKNVYLYADEIKFSLKNGTDITEILNLPTPKPHKNYQIYDGNKSFFVPSIVSLKSWTDELIKNYDFPISHLFTLS